MEFFKWTDKSKIDKKSYLVSSITSYLILECKKNSNIKGLWVWFLKDWLIEPKKITIFKKTKTLTLDKIFLEKTIFQCSLSIFTSNSRFLLMNE